jgi:NAD(P)-dependent dehydrogenase (short-subunit alcohol dehydrogenase family)
MTAVVRHIASAWGHQGIRANAVAPGVVPGEELLETMPNDRRARILRMARSDRIGRADDIAAMVAFLLSDDGAWVTAQVLGVDGGNTMRP